ncbi:MAG: shikimate kinase [Flavobacteriales bacterium]
MIKQPIFLVGMMGAGKTSLGSALAEKMAVPFLDTDQWIEDKAGKSISSIFKEDGESTFRTWEQTCLSEINHTPQMIATGGGLPCFNANMTQLLEKGLVIYLEMTSLELYERVKNDAHRPLLSNESNLQQKIEELLELRASTYLQATFCIQANKPVEELVKEIVRQIDSI